MDSLIFALNATMPIFLIIVVGWFLRQRGLLPKEFTGTADKFVFRVASPCFLFYDISTSDFYGTFDGTFVLFCVIGSMLMFVISWGAALLFIKDKSIISAFSQAAARGSAAILGIAFMQNVYGEAGQLPMMIAASVPIFNVMSVIILTFSAPQEENAPKLNGASLIKDSLYKIVT
ncbi:MAG: AEC family transporter, partial [Firmicutes bacterium]|nr:AEC family transporter [Bacillota bacterium]